MREIAHQKYLLGFFFPFRELPTAPEPMFTENSLNDVIQRRDVPFRG